MSVKQRVIWFRGSAVIRRAVRFGDGAAACCAVRSGNSIVLSGTVCFCLGYARCGGVLFSRGRVAWSIVRWRSSGVSSGAVGVKYSTVNYRNGQVV